MINIVIPMAGAGSRFGIEGYSKPKPFIDVAGKPMIVRVMENLAFPNVNYILIGQRKHLKEQAKLVKEINKKFGSTIIEIDGLTEGTACTVLFARKLINNKTPLLIANSDQIVDFNPTSFVSDCLNRQLDGSILTFIDKNRDPKWSFVRINEKKLVTEVKEKEVISEFATAGIYLYSNGYNFVDAAIEMILKRDKVNNEYYTCPTYNYMIREKKKIGIFLVPSNSMHGIGTPSDLNSYIKLLKKN